MTTLTQSQPVVHTPSHLSWMHAFKDACIAGIVTLILLGPITNLVLKQYDFIFLPWRQPIILNGMALALLVFIGRFIVALLAQTKRGKLFLSLFKRSTQHAVRVETYTAPSRKKTLLLIGGWIVAGSALMLLGLKGVLPIGASSALTLMLLFVLFAYGISLPKSKHHPHHWKGLVPLFFIMGFILPILLNYYQLLPKVWLDNLTLALIYVLLGLGLNIVVGMAGLLDLGYVAFYAVGAYFLALGYQYFDIGFWTALLFAPVLAAISGAILAFPVLRMHGDYLAIVTLGFGEIIRLVLTSWVDITGGPNGIAAPSPTLFGLEFSRRASSGGQTFHDFFHIPYSNDHRSLLIYLTLFAVVALSLRFFNRLRYMPLGRSWEALREDEIACRSLGINHVNVKLSAFMMGAVAGGVAGVFFATYQGFINPTSFNFFESVLILSIVVLGGMGSMLGVIIAALVLTLLPELLRDFANYRVLVFGLLMILMMIWRPHGLIRGRRPAFKGASQ